MSSIFLSFKTKWFVASNFKGEEWKMCQSGKAYYVQRDKNINLRNKSKEAIGWKLRSVCHTRPGCNKDPWYFEDWRCILCRTTTWQLSLWKSGAWRHCISWDENQREWNSCRISSNTRWWEFISKSLWMPLESCKRWTIQICSNEPESESQPRMCEKNEPCWAHPLFDLSCLCTRKLWIKPNHNNQSIIILCLCKEANIEMIFNLIDFILFVLVGFKKNIGTSSLTKHPDLN